ncbi:GL25355 [Drosophila persimilis]|uniref:GL25355 n=1 Tax=Drosophila persimilis TaxID=7234 RepID=B4HCL3_DROPE|nr:GL25355 [Drosophila persimilis]
MRSTSSQHFTRKPSAPPRLRRRDCDNADNAILMIPLFFIDPTSTSNIDFLLPVNNCNSAAAYNNSDDPNNSAAAEVPLPRSSIGFFKNYKSRFKQSHSDIQ